MATPHRVLVLGATGSTGRLVVSQALERGHRVTAVSRHADMLSLVHPELTKTAADVTATPSPLPGLVTGHDVVISALGTGRGLRSGGLMAQATRAIVAAMKGQGARRLVVVSSFGVAGTAPKAPLIFRVMFRTMLANVYADKALAESLIRASELDWTILAPVLLTDGAGTGRPRLAAEATGGPWKVSRADVAAAVLACIDDRATVGKRLVVMP